MTLIAGTRLGPYEIVSPLGAGGMGEVYRARDTRLGRDVAVKVLPGHLSAHPDLKSRFEREARSVSSLNHPHICTLHDIGRDRDIDYLVMELVEGETLADRLKRGPLPTPDVLRIGAQIADALDRAHRAGIVHRDLKPGNVMLTRAGAKLMDFGLARSTGLAGPAGASGLTMTALTQSPTVAQPLTAEGTLVGTFQYMAPEQLEGREADNRSDIWALGCVLYEMATGTRAFEATSQASLIGAIMYKEPRPVSELAPMSPPALDRLVRVCLAKDPGDRLQSAHDVKLQLEWAAEGASPSSITGMPAIPAAPPPSRRSGISPVAGAALLVAGVVLGGALWNFLRPAPKREDPQFRFTIQAPPRVDLVNDSNEMSISPDGTILVFLANDSTGAGSLWIRRLGSFEATELPGTRNAFLPFWSPDSRQIGFFADSKLKKVRITGGNPEILCEAATGRGASWNASGTIVFSPAPTGPLFAIPATGGKPEPVTVVDTASGESAHRWPCFLPDGKHFTYAALPEKQGQFACYVGSLDSPERSLLFEANGAPVYAEPGYLVFRRGSALVGQRFDWRKRQVFGEPIAIGDPPIPSLYTGSAGVSASTGGILAWMGAGKSDTRLVWLDRTGRQIGRVDIPLDNWGQGVLSPDGRHLVIEQSLPSGDSDLWTVDLEREVVTRLTFQSGKNDPGPWSPDGREILFASTRKGTRDIYRRNADGSGSDRLLYESAVPFKSPWAWSRDGHIVFGENGDRNGWNLMLLPEEGGTATPWLVTPFNEQNASLSPDGRWLLYTSDESGNGQSYVQSFPTPGRKQQVTRTGSFVAEWARNGREIFVLRPDLTVLSVPVEGNPDLRFGTPRELFRIAPDTRFMTLMPDGDRFLAVLPAERVVPGISVAVNWWQDADE